MKRLWSVLLAAALVWGAALPGQPVYGQMPTVYSKAELLDFIEAKVQDHADSFSVHYQGSQNLVDDNVVDDITALDGSERNTLVNSIYGLEYLEARLSYYQKTDIRFTFTAAYEHTLQEMDRLDAELQRWLEANTSSDMYLPVKAALISRLLSDRLTYGLNADRNNAYDGYYSQNTACMGYAELSWHLLRKAGIPVKMVVGYTPDGLTDTEYLNGRITPAELTALAEQTVGVSQTLHAWNLVNLYGKWYQLDNTWLDGDQKGGGRLYPEYFLGSDGDFGRNHIWLRNEYPQAVSNWWDEGSGELRAFLKAYLGAKAYAYPPITSLAQLQGLTQEAYQQGRGSVTFRMTQGVQPYDTLPYMSGLTERIVSGYTEYRETPRYPNDGYLLTLEFQGRDPKAAEELPPMQGRVPMARGDLLDPMTLLTEPDRVLSAPVKWISLSPERLTVSGNRFTAAKEGRAFIGAYTQDRAIIIPVDITLPSLRVYLNGTAIPLSPNPLILEGRTLVPLRGIFEAMGAAVEYDAQKRTIKALRGDHSLLLTLGSRTALVNGSAVQLDVAPQILGDRAFVPARLIAESLGARVEWNALANRVEIVE